jgi:hypothetical protein
MTKEELKAFSDTMVAEIDQVIDYAKAKSFPASLRARLRALRRSATMLGNVAAPVRENAVQRVLARLRGYLK